MDREGNANEPREAEDGVLKMSGEGEATAETTKSEAGKPEEMQIHHQESGIEETEITENESPSSTKNEDEILVPEDNEPGRLEESAIATLKEPETVTSVVQEASPTKDDANVGIQREAGRQLELKDDNVLLELELSTSASALEDVGGLPQVNLSEGVIAMINDPDKDGYIPLLRAIRNRHQNPNCVECVKDLLERGADVNIKGDTFGENAAHSVILALRNKRMETGQAIEILNMLKDRGFNLINDVCCEGGYTPLFLAMELPGLDVKLLEWFQENGGNFNAVEKEFENSVLFEAIKRGQSLGILQKILLFGGVQVAVHVNKWMEDALHMSARFGHVAAMEMFLSQFQFDVNARNYNGATPLHFLFLEKGVDYEPCLKMLLERGANFEVEYDQGYIPLLFWIKSEKGNCFPTLMKMKESLPITEEIASAAMTVIVQEMERLQKFLEASTNEFAQFFLFLAGEKDAKLRLKEEAEWNLKNWGQLAEKILTHDFCNELKSRSGDDFKWEGEHAEIKGKDLGKLDISSNCSCIIRVSIEMVLVCLLACGKYEVFVKVCQFIKDFCDDVVSKE